MAATGGLFAVISPILGWLGVDFSVSEPPELVAAIRALAARYAAATEGPMTRESGPPA